MLAWRNSLSPETRRQMSARIADAFTSLPLSRQRQIFFIYCGYCSEVATAHLIHRLLAAGKTVAVPRTLPDEAAMLAVRITDPERELAPGYRGIPEPGLQLSASAVLSPGDLEVAVVPGLVFDLNGHRLGYGGGFYDRFLAVDAPRALRVGLAYSGQVVEQIAAQSHDVPMDMLITENRILTWEQPADANHRRI